MAAWTPAEIATALWLDAADAGTITLDGDNKVEQWDDKSGNDRHATQGTAAARPSVQTAELNGQDVLRFDGSDDVLSSAYQVDIADSITFAVYRGLDNGDQQFSMAMHPATDQRWYMSSQRVRKGAANTLLGAGEEDWKIVVLKGTAAQAIVRQDGSAVDTVADNNAGTTANTYIGGGNISTAHNDPDYFGNVDIAEFVFTDASLSSADIERIEGYLAHKWGLEGSLPADHPYKTFAPGKDIEVSTEVTNVTLSVERSLSISDVEIISEVEQSKTWADAADIEAISVESSSEVGAATLTRVVTLNLTNIEVSSEVNSLTLTRIACLAHADIECATEVSSIYLQRIEIIPPLWCSITPGSPYTLIAHADPSIGVTPGSPRIVAKLKE